MEVACIHANIPRMKKKIGQLDYIMKFWIKIVWILNKSGVSTFWTKVCGVKCWIKNKCRKYGVKNGNMNHLPRSDSTRTCKSFPLSKFHSLSITIWMCTISTIFCPLRLIIQKHKTFMLKNSNDWHLPCSISSQKYHLFSLVLIIVSKRSQRKH